MRAILIAAKELSLAKTRLASAIPAIERRMLALAMDDTLPNFRIHPEKMGGVIDLVLQTTREAYPALDVPFHSRWN